MVGADLFRFRSDVSVVPIHLSSHMQAIACESEVRAFSVNHADAYSTRRHRRTRRRLDPREGLIAAVSLLSLVLRYLPRSSSYPYRFYPFSYRPAFAASFAFRWLTRERASAKNVLWH